MQEQIPLESAAKPVKTVQDYGRGTLKFPPGRGKRLRRRGSRPASGEPPAQKKLVLE